METALVRIHLMRRNKIVCCVVAASLLGSRGDHGSDGQVSLSREVDRDQVVALCEWAPTLGVRLLIVGVMRVRLCFFFSVK